MEKGGSFDIDGKCEEINFLLKINFLNYEMISDDDGNYHR